MASQVLLNLLDQLRQLPREAATVEFKLNWDKPEDLGGYLSALANAAALEHRDRAWAVWGVEAETHEVKGTSFDPFAAKGKATRRSLCGSPS